MRHICVHDNSYIIPVRNSISRITNIFPIYYQKRKQHYAVICMEQCSTGTTFYVGL